MTNPIEERARWGSDLSAEQWREIAAQNLEAAAVERKLRLKAEAALTLSRNEAIEEAARVCDEYARHSVEDSAYVYLDAADAIRALKGEG